MKVVIWIDDAFAVPGSDAEKEVAEEVKEFVDSALAETGLSDYVASVAVESTATRSPRRESQVGS